MRQEDHGGNRQRADLRQNLCLVSVAAQNLILRVGKVVGGKETGQKGDTPALCRGHTIPGAVRAGPSAEMQTKLPLSRAVGAQAARPNAAPRTSGLSTGTGMARFRLVWVVPANWP